MQPVNLVLVGCGAISRHAHIPALLALREEGVIGEFALSDIDPERAQDAAQEFKVKHHGDDWRELAKRIEARALSSCLPPGINAEISCDALEAGLHVICEKPPGRHLAQAEKMAALSQDRPDLVTMIAFNRRFAPLYVEARERSDRLGDIYSFFGRFTRGSIGEQPSNTVTDWITSDGSHALDLAIATIGFPKHMSVSRRSSGAGPADNWTLHLSNDRASAVLLFGFSAGRRVERFEWTGPGFDVELELPDKGEWAQYRGGVEPLVASKLTGSDRFEVNYGFVGEYRRFLQAIAGVQERPQAHFEYGCRFMKLVDTVLGSENGQSHVIEQTPAAAPASAKADHKAQTPARSLNRSRPAVQILQSPDAQRRYFTAEALARLGEVADVRMASNGRIGLKDVDVVISGWGSEPLTPAQAAEAERLQCAIVLGASVKWALPWEALVDRGIPLFNTADAIAASVAEHCLLMTLSALRRLPAIDREMHDGKWPSGGGNGNLIKTLAKRASALPALDPLKPLLRPAAKALLYSNGNGNGSGAPRCADLQDQVIGLIGWGHIARRFAGLLQPFRATLLVCSESADDQELAAVGARRASLGEVLGGSKVISLHKGLVDSSRGLLGPRELSLISPGSVLINTARAGLIDEEALLARASKGDIVVALDVFHQEPLPRKHGIRKLSNVILSPHNASSTPECARRVGSQGLQLALDWTQGAPIEPLSRDRLAMMT